MASAEELERLNIVALIVALAEAMTTGVVADVAAAAMEVGRRIERGNPIDIAGARAAYAVVDAIDEADRRAPADGTRRANRLRPTSPAVSS